MSWNKFCFEDTGIYSFPLSSYLSDNGLSYWKVPSLEIKRNKGISRGKDDKIDSKDIAFYACTHLHKFRPSSPVKIHPTVAIIVHRKRKSAKILSIVRKNGKKQRFHAQRCLQGCRFGKCIDNQRTRSSHNRTLS